MFQKLCNYCIACNRYSTRPRLADRRRPCIYGWWEGNKISPADQPAYSVCNHSERLQTASVLLVKRLFLTTAFRSGYRFTRDYGWVPLMSNSAGTPSTLWRFKTAIYGAVQNYIANETSTQHRCPMSRWGSRNLRRILRNYSIKQLA